MIENTNSINSLIKKFGARASNNIQIFANSITTIRNEREIYHLDMLEIWGCLTNGDVYGYC